jgi:NAD(P)-dependent dehydrogenase (short-subunit alcohol dehydrogenase family)
VINIAARAALAGTKNQGAYVASKSAVVRLTESMAAELKGRGINVNCILPGTIDTPENRRAMPNAAHEKWVPPPPLPASSSFWRLTPPAPFMAPAFRSTG